MAVAKDKQVKDFQVGRYVWKIEDFSSIIESEFRSRIFEINGFRWRLLLYPKGYDGVTDHLSIYLEVPNPESLPDEWYRSTKFNVSLINQVHNQKTFKKEIEHQFEDDDYDCGFESFFPLSKLHDKSYAYLINDTCVIEAEIHVTDAFPLPTNSPSYSSTPVDIESTDDEVESFLKSISKKTTCPVSNATSVVPSFEDHASLAKARFDQLILFPLDNLVDPKIESAMVQCLSILCNNLSLLTDEQAKQIMRLKEIFPTTIREWRDAAQIKTGYQHLRSTLGKTNNLLEGLVKIEEGIRTKLDELNKREMKLKKQLEELKCTSEQLIEERIEISKQTKQVFALAKEQAGKLEGKQPKVDLANKKFEDLKSKWSSSLSSFT